MKQKNNSNKAKASEPILDFISGKTQTSAAKKVNEEYRLFTEPLAISQDEQNSKRR